VPAAPAEPALIKPLVVCRIGREALGTVGVVFRIVPDTGGGGDVYGASERAFLLAGGDELDKILDLGDPLGRHGPEFFEQGLGSLHGFSLAAQIFDHAPGLVLDDPTLDQRFDDFAVFLGELGNGLELQPHVVARAEFIFLKN